ncbi:MAG: prealbumin-like fold domain-containing protein [Collinsella sp.]
MRVYVAAGADGGFDAVSTGKDGRAGTEPAKGWTDITAQCGVSVDGKTFTVRTGDLIAALGGADASPRAPAWSPCTTRRSTARATTASRRATPTRSTCATRALFTDQSGDAGFARTPSDDACASHWDLALTKRGSDGDKPLAGAVLSIADDHGRTLAADGTWDAEGKATVTTGEDGRVTVSGRGLGQAGGPRAQGAQGLQRLRGHALP